MSYMYYVFWYVDGDIHEAYFSEKQAAEFFIQKLAETGTDAYLNKYTWRVDVER